MVSMVTVGTRVGAALLALLVLISRDAAALGTNYEHNGVTTYCWAIARATNVTNLTEADRTMTFSTRAECPVAITLTLSPSDSVHAFERVNITWTVQADFSASTAINNTELYYGRDKTGRTAQIVHSNVHSCVFGTGCDPFDDGKELVDKTVNKVANFSDNAAMFTDSLQFPEPGEYSVLAHIILPDYDESSRFDYAVYSKLTVMAAETPTAAPATDAPIKTTAVPTAETTDSSSKSSGLSGGVVIAIIIGATIIAIALAVIVTILCRRRNHNQHSDGYVEAPAQDSHCSSGPGVMKQSEAIHTADGSISGFPSAWDGNRSVGVDNAPPIIYHDQNAGPRPSDARRSSEMGGRFSSSMQPPPSYVGQHPRKKRIDSDIEL